MFAIWGCGLNADHCPRAQSPDESIEPKALLLLREVLRIASDWPIVRVLIYQEGQGRTDAPQCKPRNRHSRQQAESLAGPYPYGFGTAAFRRPPTSPYQPLITGSPLQAWTGRQGILP